MSGGFALLATTSAALGGTAATASLLPLLAPLGVLGVAGTAGMVMMSMQECRGPIQCVSASNQCCNFLINVSGAGIRFLCPESC